MSSTTTPFIEFRPISYEELKEQIDFWGTWNKNWKVKKIKRTIHNSKGSIDNIIVVGWPAQSIDPYFDKSVDLPPFHSQIHYHPTWHLRGCFLMFLAGRWSWGQDNLIHWKITKLLKFQQKWEWKGSLPWVWRKWKKRLGFAKRRICKEKLFGNWACYIGSMFQKLDWTSSQKSERVLRVKWSKWGWTRTRPIILIFFKIIYI